MGRTDDIFFVVVGWVRGIAPKYRRGLEKVSNWRGLALAIFFLRDVKKSLDKAERVCYI